MEVCLIPRPPPRVLSEQESTGVNLARLSLSMRLPRQPGSKGLVSLPARLSLRHAQTHERIYRYRSVSVYILLLYLFIYFLLLPGGPYKGHGTECNRQHVPPRSVETNHVSCWTRTTSPECWWVSERVLQLYSDPL